MGERFYNLKKSLIPDTEDEKTKDDAKAKDMELAARLAPKPKAKAPERDLELQMDYSVRPSDVGEGGASAEAANLKMRNSMFEAKAATEALKKLAKRR